MRCSSIKDEHLSPEMGNHCSICGEGELALVDCCLYRAVLFDTVKAARVC